MGLFSRQAETCFLERLAREGHSLDSLTPATGFELMFRFYAEERFDDGIVEDDGDLLLFQWGCYDWDGTGAKFELDLTRQLACEGGEDENILQLRLVFRFPADDETRSLGSGNRWCHSPNELTSFRRFVTNSQPFRTLAEREPHSRALELDIAG